MLEPNREPGGPVDDAILPYTLTVAERATWPDNPKTSHY